MTGDFGEDFIEAATREGEPYLLVTRTGEGGLRVRWSVDNWGLEGGEEEMLESVAAAMGL